MAGPDGRAAACVFVGKVMELLALHIKSGDLANTNQLADLCYSLYRCIDYALINNEVPAKGRELPMLLKEVCCKFNNDVILRTAVMVLMISVKNACRSGWFPDKDMADLLTLAKEVSMPFGDVEDIYIEPSKALTCVSKIMSRFYPLIKMENILLSLKVKPGYSAFWVDFQISESLLASGRTKLGCIQVRTNSCVRTRENHEYQGLFVAQMDNIDTSSCLVTPSEVNFLLNGYGVQGRTVGPLMEKGPQFPTDITPMVKYGINLFQALGQFNGDYIIIIASAGLTSTSDPSGLQDYVQPAPASLDSDCEIIEGPSRVSLSCPISRKRIKIPVKGHLCKHYQCFEYENFMKMNTVKPAWRCPQCNQPVCFPDLRIDQNMAKILAAAGENVDHVMILADGSWKAVLGSEERSDTTQGRSRSCDQETGESVRITKEAGNERDPQSSRGPREDNIMSRISMPISSSQNVSAASASAASDFFPPTDPTVFTDQQFGTRQFPIPSRDNPILNSNVLQQFRMGSCTANRDYPSVSTNASRTPTSVSLQAQDPHSSEQRFSFQNTQLREPLLTSPVPNVGLTLMQRQMLAQSSAAQDYWNIVGRLVDGNQARTGMGYPCTSGDQTAVLRYGQVTNGMSNSQAQSIPRTASALPSSMVSDQLGGLRNNNNKWAASEQYWQPTRRMRGGLMGDAYLDALNRFVLQPSPSPPPQASPPIPQMHATSNSISTPLQVHDEPTAVMTQTLPRTGSDPPEHNSSVPGDATNLTLKFTQHSVRLQ